jgi:glutamyl/glutaminyl-tRNA synthetase
MRSEVLTLDDMINQFNIDKISKSGAQFDFDRLEFFNQMHLRERFSYTPGNRQEMQAALASWRDLME